MQLTALKQEFLLHLGETGSRRGIDRTVGRIHALPVSPAKRTSARITKTSTRLNKTGGTL